MAGCPTFLAKKQGAGLFPVGSTDRVGNQKAKGGKVYSHPTFSSALSYQTKFTFPNLLFHPLRIKVKSNVSWEGGWKKFRNDFIFGYLMLLMRKLWHHKKKSFTLQQSLAVHEILYCHPKFGLIWYYWFGLVWYDIIVGLSAEHNNQW